jgi:hypothetical protein
MVTHLMYVIFTQTALSLRWTPTQRVNYLRTTFAGTEQTMTSRLAILGKTLIQFFNE